MFDASIKDQDDSTFLQCASLLQEAVEGFAHWARKPEMENSGHDGNIRAGLWLSEQLFHRLASISLETVIASVHERTHHGVAFLCTLGEIDGVVERINAPCQVRQIGHDMADIWVPKEVEPYDVLLR